MTRRRWTEDQLLAAVADDEVRTLSDLCRRLGLRPAGGNYEHLRDVLRSRGIDPEQRFPRRKQRPSPVPVSDHVLFWALTSHRTRAEALRRLGIEPSAYTYRLLAERIERRDWDVERFDGQGWNRGTSGRTGLTREQVLAKLTDGRRHPTSELRKLLVRSGIFERRCDACQRVTWRGHPTPLELDHINGDRHDNRLENLRLLCPNCHALTPTYRGRNIGR